MFAPATLCRGAACCALSYVMNHSCETLAAQEFADGAPSLIDGHIRVRAGAGIGVCNGNPAERLPANDPGLLLLFPVGIEERIWREGIAVRPAIDGDALDVLLDRKSTRLNSSHSSISYAVF